MPLIFWGKVGLREVSELSCAYEFQSHSCVSWQGPQMSFLSVAHSDLPQTPPPRHPRQLQGWLTQYFVCSFLVSLLSQTISF